MRSAIIRAWEAFVTKCRGLADLAVYKNLEHRGRRVRREIEKSLLSEHAMFDTNQERLDGERTRLRQALAWAPEHHSISITYDSFLLTYSTILVQATDPSPTCRGADLERLIPYFKPFPAVIEALPIKVVAAGSGCLLFNLMFRRSSFCESALRIASS
jgi:hypothetical protein